MRFVPSAVFVVLAVLTARPALAGKKIIYVTEGTPGNLAGYCINNDGSLASTASFRFLLRDGIDPANTLPRRVIVDQRVRTGSPNGVAYVVETDRIEAFRIGDGGALKRIGFTKPVNAMRVLDVAVSENGNFLYVPQSGRDRIVAYPLAADGSVGGDSTPTSCIQGKAPSEYQSIRATGGFLYVVTTDHSARIDVFKPNADGSLLAAYPDACLPSVTHGTRPPFTDPTTTGGSTRKRLSVPKPFAMGTFGGVPYLYVDERGADHIRGFRLDPATVCGDTTVGVGNFCTGVRAHPNKPRLKWQRPDSRTGRLILYEDMILHGDTLLTANFGKGRVDAFLIPTSGPRLGKLPQKPTASSNQDVRRSPVHLTADDNILYVATGALDEVDAFHLRRTDGLLLDVNPFSSTAQQTDSFPNDVAVAILPQQCQ